MIASICLNPCLDRIVEIDAFVYAGMNRIRASRTDASGKGVNVGICLQRLGHEACVLGYSFARGGDAVEARLRAEGVAFDLVQRPGELRTNLKIFDRNAQAVTEVNESGEAVDEAALRDIEALVRRYAPRSTHMVFTGSLPPGCAPDTYRRLMDAARAASPECRLVLDAEGERLTTALAARPYLIKPNRYELELALQRPLPTLGDIKTASMTLAEQTGAIVAVSMGGDGATIADAHSFYYAPALRIDVRSTVGAGDSMVSGFLDADLRGEGLAMMLKRGAAAATAACLTEGTELFTREEYERMLDRIAVDIA